MSEHIPLGFDMNDPKYTKALSVLKDIIGEDQEEEEREHLTQEEAKASAYQIRTEATWEAIRTKSHIFLSALDRPYPESWQPGQTMEHPFWSDEELEQLKAKYLTFLLSL